MVEPQRQISYRPVRVVGALLLLQLVGLVGIGVYLFSSIDWDRLLTLTDDQVQTLPGPLEKQLEQAILFAIFFVPPAVLLLVAGLSFMLLRRRGWLLASLAQSVILLACLFSYPDPRPGFAYPIIAYCILMVLYLNSRNVRAVFHSKRITPASGGSETARGG
jgi:membrane protease YdiL (CAAX protease family)